MAAVQKSLAFFAAPGVRFSAVQAGGEKLVPWVASSPVERMEVSRSESEPRTVMRGRYKEGDRSGSNQQGGGRHTIKVKRKPSMAYAIGEDESGRQEAGGQVLRRMWDMYDMDFHKMTAVRERYFRAPYRSKKWTADYNMRLGRRYKQNSMRRKLEEEWTQFMQTDGRKRGYQDPIIFKGPPMAHALTPELDAETDVKTYVAKHAPSEQELQATLDSRPKVKPYERVPDWAKPGGFPDKDAPDNMFNIWRRPLHRFPYDIGCRRACMKRKKGKGNHYVRGNIV